MLMCPQYFESRRKRNDVNKLMHWLNKVLKLKMPTTDLKGLRDGIAWCQLMHQMHPCSIRLSYVNFKPKHTEDVARNYVLLKRSMRGAGIKGHVPVDRLMEGHFVETLNFGLGMKKYHEKYYDGRTYDAAKERSSVSELRYNPSSLRNSDIEVAYWKKRYLDHSKMEAEKVQDNRREKEKLENKSKTSNIKALRKPVIQKQSKNTNESQEKEKEKELCRWHRCGVKNSKENKCDHNPKMCKICYDKRIRRLALEQFQLEMERDLNSACFKYIRDPLKRQYDKFMRNMIKNDEPEDEQYDDESPKYKELTQKYLQSQSQEILEKTQQREYQTSEVQRKQSKDEMFDDDSKHLLSPLRKPSVSAYSSRTEKEMHLQIDASDEDELTLVPSEYNDDDDGSECTLVPQRNNSSSAKKRMNKLRSTKKLQSRKCLSKIVRNK